MTYEELSDKLEKLNNEKQEAEEFMNEALARAEAAEARLAKSEKEYKFSMMWLNAIEESNRKREEAKAEEYAKAAEAAEWRRKQNEAMREEQRRWDNMTKQELDALHDELMRKVEEMRVEQEKALLEKLGSPEAVAAHKKKQQEEIAVLKAERERNLKEKKEKHEAYLRRIGVID